MAIYFYLSTAPYTPPQGDSVDCGFEGGYSAPSGGDVDFIF